MSKLRLVQVAISFFVCALTFPAAAQDLVGKKAPAFSLVDQNGKTHKLSDYAGKNVVLEWTNPLSPRLFPVEFSPSGCTRVSPWSRAL